MEVITGGYTNYDYSNLYARIATALETISGNSTGIVEILEAIATQLAITATQTTTIADQTTTIAAQTTTIADQTTTIAAQTTTIAAQTTIIAAQTTIIAAQQSILAAKMTLLEDRAADKNKGIHMLGPWEWLGISSIVKLYDEKGINFEELKTRVEQISKSGV